MKKLFFILIILIILLTAGYYTLKMIPASFMPEAQKTLLSDFEKKLTSYVSKVSESIKALWEKFTQEDSTQEQEGVVLCFKNGNKMTVDILEKDEDQYLVRWKDQEITVFAEQIDRIASGKELLKEKGNLTNDEITKLWPYDSNIAIRLKNTMAIDAPIDQVKKDELILLNAMEGGGYIKQAIKRAEIDYLIFKPVNSADSIKIEQTLQETFPQMRFFKEGNCTILTDSSIQWVRRYKQVLRVAYSDIFLKFFELFKDKIPQRQNFVVVFDSQIDFIEFAVKQGIPGWAILGYFDPRSKVLYLFNSLGDQVASALFEMLVGRTGEAIDRQSKQIKSQVSGRYHREITNEAESFKDKFGVAHHLFRKMFRSSTLKTLRHEFTHGLFHNWELQSIEVSKFIDDKLGLIEKKKNIITSGNAKEKTELVKALISFKGEELNLQAANSWLAEGLATYCETDPIGTQNDCWLHIYQEMVKEGPIYPLEYLANYKMGSFPGVCSKAMLQMYAQSWALVTFLMDKYPQEVMQYQKRMSENLALGHEDLDWLLEATGKDLRELENEFKEYMQQYADVEDPHEAMFSEIDKMFRGY